MTLDKKALYEKREEIQMRIALMELAGEEADALKIDPADKEPDPGAIRTIERALIRKHMVDLFKIRLPKILRVLAVLLLVFYLAVTAFLFLNTHTRAQFINLFLGSMPAFSELRLDLDSVFSEAPDGWKEKYYPSYIPSGWTFLKMDSDSGEAFYTRSGEDTRLFHFSVLAQDASVTFNTDGTKIRNMNIGGSLAMVAENEQSGFTWITWSTGDRMILIYIDADLGTALDIAKSVHVVKNWREPS